MQAILAVTVPFFALVLAGWLAARRGLLPASAIPGLNAYVLYFALPCLLLRFGMGTPVLELLNPWLLAIYLLCALLIVCFTIATSLNSRIGLKDASFGALVAAFPNTGFMGVARVVGWRGPTAAGPAICSILADLFVTSSLCIALSQLHAPQQGARLAALRAVRGALANPLPWSIALGAALSAAGLRLSGPIDTVVRMLADSASPVALFSIGAVLWRAGLQTQHHTRLIDYLPVALIKLFLHPLLVLVLGAAAQQLGAPVSAFQLMVLTLVAALPSASNAALLAERFGADSGRVARIIMSSTLLAFASFSALAWCLGIRPGG